MHCINKLVHVQLAIFPNELIFTFLAITSTLQNIQYAKIVSELFATRDFFKLLRVTDANNIYPLITNFVT